MKKSDFLMLAELRRNSRQRLTKLSKKTGVPVSTLFQRMRSFNEKIIKGYTILLDEAKLGFTTKAYILLKCRKDNKQAVIERLSNDWNVNSIYRINNGWDLLINGIFPSMKELEELVDSLEKEFEIKGKEVHYIIEELKREAFFTENGFIDFLAKQEEKNVF